jgi:DNA-binding MarR family transcriptional regulator
VPSRDHDWIPADSVDALIAAWAQRRPQLDVAPMGILTRLARVRRHVEGELERVFDAHGLTAGTFALLVTLERQGGTVPAAELTEALGVPGRVIDGRVSELVLQGLAARDGNGGVALTDAGRAKAASVVPAHLDNQRRLLQALDDGEREQLATLLRKLLGEYEGSRPVGDGAPVLGVTVAPAHLAAELREAVGLPPVEGLLLRVVDRDGAGGRGGLRAGDVLLAGGDRPLRSVAGLRAALADAAGGTLALRVLRGAEEEVEVVVTVPTPPSDAASPGRAAFAEHVL